MGKLKGYSLLLFTLLIVGCSAWGQMPREIHTRLAARSQALLGKDFRTDGQEWRGELRASNYIEFNLTFYAGIRYRLVCVNTLCEGAVQYTLFDSEHNVLFKSEEHNNPEYWDFEFGAATVCTVLMHEAPGHSARGQKGYALFRLGYSPPSR